jgi:Lon protease-like protein
MSVIESLALFPLSDVVLLPEISVPLYIFEPRYRQMTRDALAHANQIGMVTVRPDAIDAMAGDPELFHVGCLGRIAQAQEHPDGTFHILLLGESRFRILEEHLRTGDRLYRSARVETLADRLAEGEGEQRTLRELRAETLSQLQRLVRAVRPDADREQIFEGLDRLESAQLINALTRSISFAPIERQQLLEADSVLARFEIMRDLLRFRLAELDTVGPGSSSWSH